MLARVFGHIFGVLVFSLGFATMAMAERVTLTSLDGTTVINGDFLSFDGANYKIRTILGDLTIDAFQVECKGDACPSLDQDAERFTIAGSTGLVDSLFSDLLFEFGAQIGGRALTSMGEGGNPLIQLQNENGKELAQITLAPSSSGTGLSELMIGNAQLAVTTRSVRTVEYSAARDSGLGDLSSAEQETIFALDGLVAVTSINNPMRAIAEADLAKIFSGQITNWNEIGGPSAKINLYVRAAGSGTGIVFDELVMQPARAQFAADARILDSDAEVAASVAGDPLGIGITGLAATSGSGAKVLAIRGTCGIQVPATPFTIKTEEYPLSRRIYAYQRGTDVPIQLSRFLRFLETDAARDVISDGGFVDLGVSFQTNNEQGLRYLSAVMPTDAETSLQQLREMTGGLAASDRSSITFRFAHGSSRLDARAQDDILRLAELIATGEFQNKELLLIGFTDSVGSGSANLALSARRADEVRQALIAAAPAGSLESVQIRVLGYGEISPLSCNDTENGRRINRRVEVWFRDIVIQSR